MDDQRSGNRTDGLLSDAWTESLERYGRVEFTLSKPKIAVAFAGILIDLLVAVLLLWSFGAAFGIVVGGMTVLMFLFLALLPLLEFATAPGPAVRVDSRGIVIARWARLEIPWSEVVSVGVVRINRVLPVVMVHVSDTFYRTYRTSMPFSLRAADALTKRLLGPAFPILWTTKARSGRLAAWLDSEVQRRHGGSVA